MNRLWLTARICWVEATLCGGLAIFYALTAFPGPGGRINFGDSAKFAYLPVVGGTPHSTGYPLYLLLSKLAYLVLPFEHAAHRAVALSVLFGSATVVCVYTMAWQVTGRRLPSALSAVLFGLGGTFWTQATEVEVYALHAFMVTLVASLMLRFHKTGRHGLLLVASFFYALSFGNHLSVVTMLPAMVYLTVRTDPHVVRRVATVLPIGGFILLGILQYGYIPRVRPARRRPRTHLHVRNRRTVWESLLRLFVLAGLVLACRGLPR
jgi:dolichyl-phosphate-mannose--protein O-mannosyl transferase